MSAFSGPRVPQGRTIAAHRPGRRRGRRALPLLSLLLLFAGVGAAGCSSEQVYNAAQGWRRNECYKIADLAQRERCLQEANRPYDAYGKAANP